MDPPLEIPALRERLRKISAEAERDLVVFRRQYLQRLDVKHVCWPCAKLLRIYDIQRWIFTFVTDKVHAKSRTRQDYGFLSELVRRIESAVQDAEEPDIYDPLVELCAELCMQRRGPDAEAAQQDVWVTYTTPDPPDLSAESIMIRLIEKPRVLSAGGCSGYRTWQAALTLASVIASQWLPLGLLRGKSVLELGAGTGLLSFLCAYRADARAVICTDGDSDAVDRLLMNRDANFPGAEGPKRISCGVYRWNEHFEGTIIEAQIQSSPFNVVLAADVTYDPDSIPDLVKTLFNLIQLCKDTVVVVAATLRNETTFDRFLQECDSLHLRTQVTAYCSPPLAAQLAFFTPAEETIMLVTISGSQALSGEAQTLCNAIHGNSLS